MEARPGPQVKTAPYSSDPDPMIYGLKMPVAGQAGVSHPLQEKISKKAIIEEMSIHSLQKIQGIHAPLRLQMEQRAAQKVGRLPCLQSSNLMAEVLSGEDEMIDFTSFLNPPEFQESTAQPHIMIEKKLGVMDAYDIFKKLSKGAHFDFKRFRNDAMIPDWPKPPLASAAATSKEIEDEGESKDPVPSDASDTSLSLGEDDSGLEDESANDLEGEEEEREEGTRVRLLGDLVADDGDRKKRKRKIKVQGPEHAAAMHREQVNRLKNIHRIHAWGSDIPEPIRTFEDLGSHGIHELVIRNITKMGYESPTPIQMQAIPLLAQRRELLACAPTGSGKTAAFLVPVLSHLKGPEKRGFRAVIVAPTRELAGQIYREALNLAEGLRLKIHIIEKISKAMKKFGPKTAGKYDLLVTTPNRLVYLLKQEPPVLSLANVEWLIVDESDKLFEAGQRGFRDQLAVIYNACGDSSKARRALFSATFAFEVQEWCKLNLDNLAMVSIGARNAAVDTVDQELVYVGNEHGKLVAFRDLVRKGLTPPVLVFVQSKERARELFHELIYDGINVDVIHSDRSKLQRDNVVKGFRRGRIWVLICTELMGRGMDFKGVNLVVNYDFPPSSISYIHRIGRTGRAGRQGKAITFFTEEDKANLRTIAQVVKDSGCEVPDYMLRLKKPTKKEKRSLERRAPKREPISTVTRYDKERKLKRMRAVEKSRAAKRKKLQDSPQAS